MSISRILSALAIDTPASAISVEAHEACRRMLLDTCGCIWCGHDAPGIDILTELECELSACGPARLFFSSQRMSLPAAVSCNAAMAHALDFDNNYPGADIHIMSIVMPIAFACGEDTGATYEHVQDGIILGVEVAARIAKPFIQARRQHSWFLTTSLVGGWGGVACAARLLGLTTEQTVQAMGIFYAQTCGNRQALLERSLTKRIQPALAAKAAVYAVLLARRGFTGPELTFEGRAGFYACYTQDPAPAAEVFAHSRICAIEELSVKHFPTCGIHHACIVSAITLKQQHDFTADDIERVDFYLHEGGGTLVSMPYEPGPFPQIPQIDAQFCAPYAIALALNRGAVTPADFTTERILAEHDTEALAQRTYECPHFADLGIQNEAMCQPGYLYLKVTLNSGRILEHSSAAAPLNDPAGMDNEQVRAKFHSCLSMHGPINEVQANHLADAITLSSDDTAIGVLIERLFGPDAYERVR